jgi:hypothetical protein
VQCFILILLPWVSSSDSKVAQKDTDPIIEILAPVDRIVHKSEEITISLRLGRNVSTTIVLAGSQKADYLKSFDEVIQKTEERIKTLRGVSDSKEPASKTAHELKVQENLLGKYRFGFAEWVVLRGLLELKGGQLVFSGAARYSSGSSFPPAAVQPPERQKGWAKKRCQDP